MPLTPPSPVTPEEVDPAQGLPALACGSDSAFTAVWEEFGVITYVKLKGRAFAPGGPSLSSDFTIGLIDGGDGVPSVARLRDGDLLVAWTDCGLPSGCDIFGQRFTSMGATECPGDCNRDGRVTVDELVKAVTIALDPDPSLTKQCLPADVNLD
jgi:hypothetical protein